MSIDENEVQLTPRRGRPPKNLSPVQLMLSEPVEVDDSSLVKSDENSSKRPTPKDPEWTDFVLGHLQLNEKDQKNGFPKTFGLKRLVLLLIGDIKVSSSRLVGAPNDSNNFNASADHTLEIEGYNGLTYLYVGLGGSNERNSDPPYGKYPETVASSRAYARALKDALTINCVTAEELSEVAEKVEEVNTDSVESASSVQKVGIKTMCKNLGVDVTKFINIGEKQYASLEDANLTKEKAKLMVNLLNKYQCGSEIPENIKL